MLEKFLSLGVAASVAIIVGGLIVFIVCVAAVVCCCRRCCCKPDLSNSGTASAPSSLVANGNPTLLHGNGNAQQDRGMPSFSTLAYQLNICLLALCILETPKRVLWQTVKTQMKCSIMLHFIRVCTVLFDLILYVPSTIFQLNRDGSSWVEPVLS